MAIPSVNPSNLSATITFKPGKWLVGTIIPEEVIAKAFDEFRQKLPKAGNMVLGQREFGPSHVVKSLRAVEKGEYEAVIEVTPDKAGGVVLQKMLDQGNPLHLVDKGTFKKEGQTITKYEVTSIDFVETAKV